MAVSNYDLFTRGATNLAYDKTKLDNVASVSGDGYPAAFC